MEMGYQHKGLHFAIRLEYLPILMARSMRLIRITTG